MPARIAKYWLRRNETAALPLDSVDARSCVNRLRSLSEAGIALCRRSRRLEATSDDITAAAYIAAWRGQPLADPPYATVITKLHVSSPEMSNVAQLIIGHEAAGVVLMDNTSFTVTMSWELEGVPAMIEVIGAHFDMLVPVSIAPADVPHHCQTICSGLPQPQGQYSCRRCITRTRASPDLSIMCGPTQVVRLFALAVLWTA